MDWQRYADQRKNGHINGWMDARTNLLKDGLIDQYCFWNRSHSPSKVWIITFNSYQQRSGARSFTFGTIGEVTYQLKTVAERNLDKDDASNVKYFLKSLVNWSFTASILVAVTRRLNEGNSSNYYQNKSDQNLVGLWVVQA